MANFTITPDIARCLVRQFFGDKFEFEIVGSLVTSSTPSVAEDIDFIISKHDFNNRLRGRLKPQVNWVESEYFPASSYKTTIGGIKFNAIALDKDDYTKWLWAVRALKNAPAALKPSAKHLRVAVWRWLLSIAPDLELSFEDLAVAGIHII